MKAIQVISIPISDQQASKEFYEKVGFKLLVEAPMGDGNTWVQLGLPDQVTSISLVHWFTKMAPGHIEGLVISTDDIEKDVAELNAKGVTTTPIDNTPWGRFSAFTDPDDNGWILRGEIKV